MKKLLVKKVGEEYVVKMYGTDYELLMPLEAVKPVSKGARSKKSRKTKGKKK